MVKKTTTKKSGTTKKTSGKSKVAKTTKSKVASTAATTSVEETANEIKTLLSETSTAVSPKLLASVAGQYLGREGLIRLIEHIKDELPSNLFVLKDPLYYFVPAENTTLTQSYNARSDEWVDGMQYITIVSEDGMQLMDGFDQMTYRIIALDEDGTQVSAISITTISVLYGNTFLCFKLATTVALTGTYKFRFQYNDSGSWYNVPEGWLIFGTKKSFEGFPFSYTLK